MPAPRPALSVVLGLVALLAGCGEGEGSAGDTTAADAAGEADARRVSLKNEAGENEAGENEAAGEREPSAASAAGVPAPDRAVGPTSPAARLPAQSVDSSRSTAITRASERVSPSVVSVNVIRTRRVRPRSMWESFFLPPGAARRTSGLGSGFIYDSDGLVLTNDHVIRDADRIMVTLPDGRDFEAELVGRDEVTDVAVLRIQGADLPVAPLGTSDGLLIGEWTVAIGNPFGYMLSNAEPTVTAGVISAVDRHIIPSEDDDQGVYLGMIQTDASINPGNSGGPLVNALGEVVGINTSIFSRSGGSEGLGFAIPVDRAVRIAWDLVRHGQVRRAWTGMDVEPAEADDWGRRRGVRVSRVTPDSPADRAGIESGDRLVRAQGRRLATPLDFEALLLDLRAGDELSVRIEGRSEPVSLETEPLPSLRAERVEVLEELELITVTPEVRAERQVSSERGALILSISARMQRQVGLRSGDVILQINNTTVRTAREAARALRDAAGSGTVRLYFERNGGIGVRTFYWGR